MQGTGNREQASEARQVAREVMSIRAAAAYLDMSIDTLYGKAARGEVPAFKLGNRWKFRKSRLDAWMDELALKHVRDARAARGSQSSAAR